MNFLFFAYGLFRPGQLAFFQIRDFVSRVTKPVQVTGVLRLRDGLPIIELKGREPVNGALLIFKPGKAEAAYDKVSAMEPDNHYNWEEVQADGNPANVLVGRFPRKASVRFEGDDWNGWDDPLFKEALEVVEDEIPSTPNFNDVNLKPLFRLQMAYLLLWSSIERYVSLKYHLGEKVKQKVDCLAKEPAFGSALRRVVARERTVFRASKPKTMETLDPSDPKKSLDYYYQVRCNMTHRGKAAVPDRGIVKHALTELLQIFEGVLKEGFSV